WNQRATDQSRVHPDRAEGIDPRSEMADLLARGGVTTGYGDFDDRARRPRRTGQNFRLKAISACAATRDLQQPEGIDAQAALAVVDAQAALQPHEQVRDPPPGA